jgi:hypothetical protein
LAPAGGLRDLPASRSSALSPGARYTIPAEADCRACHEGAPVPVLGFSALQLSPDRDPLAPHADDPAARQELTTIDTLIARGLLRNLPPALRAPRIAASSPVERAALGYLHGNCGNCHNDDGPLAVSGDDAGANVLLAGIVNRRAELHRRRRRASFMRVRPRRAAHRPATWPRA